MEPKPANSTLAPAGPAPVSRPDRPPRSDRPRDDREGGRGRRFGPPVRRVCVFCVDPKRVIDYKDGDALRRYLTDRGKIKPRRKVGTCARHQRVLSAAIKRARHVALLPFVTESTRGE